jgi:leucyl aminopeptidase (aminopeptidase T)
MAVAYSMNIPAQLFILPFNSKARSKFDFYNYNPPKTIMNAMIGADVIIGCTIHSLVNWYSPYRKKIMETSRILWVKPIEDFLLRVAGSEVDINKLRKRGEVIAELFKKTKTMKITSQSGTDVTISSIRNSAGYNIQGEVFKAGDESGFPGGNFYGNFNMESVNGTIVFDGAMKMLGVLKEPIKLTIKKDKITKIEGGKQAKQLADFIEELNDPNFPYIIHMGLGVNPGAIVGWNSSDFECVDGTIIWGVGRQPVFYENEEQLYSKEKGNIARNHFDCTTLNATLWMDDKLILKDGEWILPELK